MTADDIRELFASFGPVEVRRMFGGAGVYADGTMFALEAGGELYLKVDDGFALDLAGRGSVPFTYEAKGRRTIMSYWKMPEAALDDGEDLAALARRALEIARAARRAKTASTGRRKTSAVSKTPSKRGRPPRGGTASGE
ncbi:TfoX/Sxy family protein [Roseixanthobacter glucoisosaccharinicivorans]|uniref:TfoX/Sxy family protein n=1 Tax=Roseixanthobacter glucoisosaccharinicivorans TaxID=3119923 RepID=UPI0037286661